jgi:hypothetical protein
VNAGQQRKTDEFEVETFVGTPSHELNEDEAERREHPRMGPAQNQQEQYRSAQNSDRERNEKAKKWWSSPRAHKPNFFKTAGKMSQPWHTNQNHVTLTVRSSAKIHIEAIRRKHGAGCRKHMPMGQLRGQ